MARTVLVTGGNRGIGLAIAQAFAKQGDRVAVTHRSGEAPAGLFGVKCDVTDAESLDAAFTAIEAELGPVEVLVANAGITDDTLLLRMSDEFAGRYVNEGFSGGEKKRAEILQMAMLQPKYAVLDETDSGLDIDALRIVADGVNALLGPEMGVLVITHYQRLLNYIKPDYVHVLVNGKIVAEGGPELALSLEQTGYEQFEPAATPA